MWNHVLLLTAATVANARSEAAVVGVTLTSTDQSHLFEAQTPLSLGPAAANPNIRVEGGTAYQRVVGYGAAITDASAWVLHSAPPLLYDAMMKLLFSPLGSTGSKGGVGLSIVRVPIGVSDFSISYAPGNITYADTPGDWDLEHFSTAHDDAYILPVLRRARQLNPRLKIVASPWTAPLWLKTEGGTLGRGTLLPSERVYETYARYFVKFVLDYLRKGVVVDYITLQNEPGHAGCGTMPCMLLAEPDEARLAVLVGQQLAAAGLGKQTRILGYDHNWGAQPGVAISGPKYPMALFANATVAAYIAGTAWHCYGGSESAQTPVHAAHPTKETHMTECSGGGWSGPWASNFVSNIRRLFIGNSNAWGQSALLWNMALDEHAGPRCQGGACCTDCRGVLTVPSNSSSLADIERNVEFYSLAHFSAFVPQGSVRVKSQRAPASSVPAARHHLQSTGRGLPACGSYCATTSCKWTKDYSCPWAPAPGREGRAGADGSTGFACCCVERWAAAQPCGGNGTAPPPSADGGSVQFTAFRTPAAAKQRATEEAGTGAQMVLQVLNPTSGNVEVSVDTGEVDASGGKLGFSYPLPPGLATFVWPALP